MSSVSWASASSSLSGRGAIAGDVIAGDVIASDGGAFTGVAVLPERVGECDAGGDQVPVGLQWLGTDRYLTMGT